MTDAAKSDGQVLAEAQNVDWSVLPHQVRAAYDSEAAAVVANAASRIRAETVVKAKPLVWKESPGQWDEHGFGFSVSLNIEGDSTQYDASWGEGDADTFPTLKNAQEWCQKNADDFAAKNCALAAAPPGFVCVPVEVDDAEIQRLIEVWFHKDIDHNGLAQRMRILRQAMLAALEAENARLRNIEKQLTDLN